MYPIDVWSSLMMMQMWNTAPHLSFDEEGIFSLIVVDGAATAGVNVLVFIMN